MIAYFNGEFLAKETIAISRMTGGFCLPTAFMR